MYATIHPFRQPAGPGPAVPQDVAHALPAGADPAGVVTFDDVLHEGRGTVVALWAGQQPVPPADRVYAVVDVLHGRSVGAAARCSPSSPG